jgi:hypothetical protein
LYGNSNGSQKQEAITGTKTNETKLTLKQVPTLKIGQPVNLKIEHIDHQPTKSAFVEHSIDQSFKPDFKVTDTSINSAQFNLPKLKKMLSQFGQFPDKYRLMTW